MMTKYLWYALGIKVAITGVVLLMLWKRRQESLKDDLALEGDPLPL